MSKTDEIFHLLNGMRPIAAQIQETRFEKWAARSTLQLNIRAGGAFAVVGYLAIAIITIGLSDYFLMCTLLLACYSALLGVLSAWIGTAHLAVSAIHHLLNKAQAAMVETSYDLTHVAELIQFSEYDLNCVMKRLDTHIQREERRIAFWLGGKERLAILAVMGTAWGYLKDYPIGFPTWAQPYSLLLMAAPAGLYIGGIFMYRYLRLRHYHKDILVLTLEHKKEPVTLQRHYAYPAAPKIVRIKNAYYGFVAQVAA